MRVLCDRVTIRKCVDTDAWSYWFVCPKCRGRSAARTSASAAMGAVAAGSNLQTWSLPAELNEHPDGPPFKLVDLVELRLLLIDDDWIDQLR